MSEASREGPSPRHVGEPDRLADSVATLSAVVERDEWPRDLPRSGEGTDPGIPVWSLPVEVVGFSGLVEGRTTGYDPATRSIRITAGTGLSTTTATDRPNTRKPPPPRSEWPSRSRLGPSWNA